MCVWAVLQEINISARLIKIVIALYADLCTSTQYNGCELNTIYAPIGIKQACALSGSIFALAANLLIRAHLSRALLVECSDRLVRR